MLRQNLLPHRVPRNLPHAIAFVGGGLLMFSWTRLSPIDILAMLAGLVTLLDVVRKKDLSWLLERRNLVLLAFGALVALQCLFYPLQDPVPSLITMYLIGTCLCIRYWARTYPDLLYALAYGYVLGAVASSLLGFAAYLLRISTGGSVVLPLFWRGDVRLAGFFDDPNIYGAYLIPALIALLWLTLMRRWNPAAAVVLYAALFLVYVNVLLSGSRGAWLNAVVVAVVAGIVFHKELLGAFRKLLVLGVVGACTATVVIFLVPVRDGATFFDYSLATRKVSSDAPRFENLHAAPRQVTDRSAAGIVLGTGTGSYQERSPNGLAAHNTYLTTLYEQGVFGLLLLLLYVLTPLNALRRGTRNAAAVLLAALLLGTLIEGFYIDILHWRHLWVLLAFI